MRLSINWRLSKNRSYGGLIDIHWSFYFLGKTVGIYNRKLTNKKGVVRLFGELIIKWMMRKEEKKEWLWDRGKKVKSTKWGHFECHCDIPVAGAENVYAPVRIRRCYCRRVQLMSTNCAVTQKPMQFLTPPYRLWMWRWFVFRCI